MAKINRPRYNKRGRKTVQKKSTFGWQALEVDFL